MAGATLLLEALRLAGAPKLRLEADGTIGAADAAVVIGEGVTVPAALRARFPAAVDPPDSDTALLVGSAGGDRAWLATLSPGGASVHASAPLAAADLRPPPGLAFDPGATLDIALTVSDGRLERAEATVRGRVSVVAQVGPLAPAAATAFTLAVTLDGTPDRPVAADPGSVLDAAFTGTLTMGASALTLGAVYVAGTAALRFAVHSAAGGRSLEVIEAELSVESPAPLGLAGTAAGHAGLALTDARLHGTLRGPALREVALSGTAQVRLPDVLGGAVTGGGVAEVRLSAGTDTELRIGVPGLAFTGPATLLATAAARPELTLRSEAGGWRLAVALDTRLTWPDLRDRLGAAGLVSLPAFGGGDARVRTCVDVTTTGAASVRAEILLESFDGLPIEAHDLVLALEASTAASGTAAWSVTGSGRLSTLGWLRDAFPISDLPVLVTAAGDDGPPALRLTVGAGLPPLTLPSFDGGTLDLLALNALTFELAEGVRVSGKVTFARPRPEQAAAALGLPAPFAPLLSELGAALPDHGELTVHSGGEDAAVEVVLRPSSPPTFDLFDTLSGIVNPTGRTDATSTQMPGSPVDFFTVTPGELRIGARLGGAAGLHLSATLDCEVFGESFDLTLALEVVDGDVELSLLAGRTDPILLTVPAPDARAMLGNADVNGIATTYGLNNAQRATLADVRDAFQAMADALGAQGVAAIEVRNFGLVINADGPALSGDARLVRLPRLLDALGPLARVRLGLGTSVEELFIDIELEAADNPLLTVPLPGGETLDLVLGRFRLAYAWGQNAFAFQLVAEAVPSTAIDATVGGTGVVFNGVSADISIGVTATAPPAPVPQGRLTFTRGAPMSAAEDLGLQAVIGNGDDRYVTAYVRTVEVTPTAFLLWPGVRVDGGFIAGGPNPKDFPRAEDYLDVADWNRDQVFARFTVTDALVVFIDPLAGLLLNPLAIIPPFVTANPPFWLVPPLMMGDLYADEVGISLNLPGLVFFDLTYERPVPGLSLQALLEFAALAAGGFTRPIAPGSPLREMFYARIRVRAELGLGSGEPLDMTLEVNVADFINGAIDLLGKGRATLDAGSDLITAITDDPAALVRMVPRQARRFAYDIKVAGFEMSGSLFLLTPEEVEEELVLFFENRRPKPRGIAANTPAPRPASGGINQLPVLHDEFVDVVDRFADVRTAAPPLALFAKRLTVGAGVMLEARARDVAGLERRRADSVARAITSVAEATDKAARATLLRSLGVASLAAKVEQSLTRAGLSPAARRKAVAVILKPALDDGEDFVVVEANTKLDAGSLADDVLAGRPVDDRVKRAIAPHASVIASLGQSDKLGRAAVRRTLADAITREFGGKTVTAKGLAHLTHLTRTTAGLASLITAAGGAAPVKGRQRSTTFDGRRLADLVGRFRGRRPTAPLGEAMVKEPQGYVIRPRAGAAFAIPVDVPAATYKVALRGGRYRLLVRAADGTWTAHALPDAFVATVPEGLGKAKALRDRLVVGPRQRQRMPTPSELEAVKPQFEAGPSLYRTSVFARPEYEIKPTGGVHGTMYLADLLRDPHSHVYMVPDDPALLAGVTASLFGNVVGLAGMVVAGQSGLNIFLHGHHQLDIRVDPFRLTTTGELTAIIGDLWEAVPLPGGVFVGGGGGAIAFAGHVDLRAGRDRLLWGKAVGTFQRTASGVTRASLTVSVASEGYVDAGIGDAEFFRVSWELAGNLTVDVDDDDLTILTGLQANVTIARAMYPTNTIIDEPAYELCAWVWTLDRGWFKACITTPAVTIEVPDLTAEPDWDPFGEFSCALRATTGSSGGTFELDLQSFGSSVTAVTGRWLEIGALT